MVFPSVDDPLLYYLYKKEGFQSSAQAQRAQLKTTYSTGLAKEKQNSLLRTHKINKNPIQIQIPSDSAGFSCNGDLSCSFRLNPIDFSAAYSSLGKREISAVDIENRRQSFFIKILYKHG